MTVVTEVVVELRATLKCAHAREVDAARDELAKRVAAVVPFRRLHVGSGVAEVIAATVTQLDAGGRPLPKKPIRVVPRPSQATE